MSDWGTAEILDDDDPDVCPKMSKQGNRCNKRAGHSAEEWGHLTAATGGTWAVEDEA